MLRLWGKLDEWPWTTEAPNISSQAITVYCHQPVRLNLIMGAVTVTACAMYNCTPRRQLSLWRNAASDIWETRVGIWRLITLIILSILLLTQLVSDKLACVPSQLNGLCRKKQIGHIYQSCRNSHRTNSAHLPNLCIMEIPILTVFHFMQLSAKWCDNVP